MMVRPIYLRGFGYQFLTKAGNLTAVPLLVQQ